MSIEEYKDHCYKCGATDRPLSRRGKYSMMCHPCRNNEAQRYKKPHSNPHLDLSEWAIKAKENNSRIIEKYQRAHQ